MRLYVASQLTLPRAIQEIAALTITHPVEITVKRAERRMTDAKRARIHIALRDCAHHFGYSLDAFKLLVKRGEVPGVDWPGTHVHPKPSATADGIHRFIAGEGYTPPPVWVPKPTMKLTKDEAETVLTQIEQFGSEHGVEWSAHESMEVA